MLRWLLIALLFAVPAWAEEVVLGLSQDEVAITTSFDGSEILIFGAVKRETTIPEGELGVIVTIAGPHEPITVRRKERRFGIWVNTDAVEIDCAPSFYAVATSAALDDVLGIRDNLQHKVSVPSMLRGVETPNTVLDASAYVAALIRINTNTGAYQLLEDTVIVDEDTLFRTRIRLPAALTEGAYETRIFLTRDGQVIASYETAIDVRKVAWNGGCSL
jgi:uncharacterized protein (TIGR02186 family)